MLWGVGTSHAGAAARDSEHAWFEDYPACLRVLESAGNRMLRRALRAVPEALRWDISGDEVELQFTLRRGAFATSLLREVGDFVDAASRTGEANATA